MCWIKLAACLPSFPLQIIRQSSYGIWCCTVCRKKRCQFLQGKVRT